MSIEVDKLEAHTVEDIQQAVKELLEDKGLKPDEVFILLYASGDRWVVWIYPPDPDLDIVETLLGTSLVQAKQLKAVKEKTNKSKAQDKMREIYTC